MGKTAFAVILGIVLLASAGCGSLPKERAVALPGLADASGSVTLIDGFYYYGGYKGKTPCIYKTPVAAPDRNSVVYEFKDWNDPYREYPLTHVYKEDGQLYISYAFGGATLAGEKRLKVSEKGSVEPVELEGLNFRKAEGGYVYADMNMPSVRGNLYFTKKRPGDAVPIGDSQYVYGSIGGGGQCRGASDMMLIRDGWVYIPAFRYDDAVWTTYVWKVNIKTHEAVQVTHVPLDACTTSGEYVYTTALDGQLYRTPLKGGPDERILEGPVVSYAASQGNLWYVDSKSRLHRKSESGIDTVLFKDVPVQSVKVENGHVVCDLAVGGKTGLMVLNANGGQEYRTDKTVGSYSIEGNLVVFREPESLRVYQVQLR